MADYAFRTPLSWWIFVVALLVVASVSAIVLFWQVHKAANVNPAEVMKRE
jgi:ABC-type antimicrobial peptide transport system permease subunit